MQKYLVRSKNNLWEIKIEVLQCIACIPITVHSFPYTFILSSWALSVIHTISFIEDYSCNPS